MGIAEGSTCIVARESLRAPAAAEARARKSVARDASYLSARHASSPGTATSPRPAKHDAHLTPRRHTSYPHHEVAMKMKITMTGNQRPGTAEQDDIVAG